MPSFQPILKESEIPTSNTWQKATKFQSKDRIVNRRGKTLQTGHNGRKYRLIAKNERPYTFIESSARRSLGILAVIFTLGIALLSSTIRKMFTKNVKNIRYGIELPSLIHSKPSSKDYNISEGHLNEGVTISKDTLTKIQNCMQKILKKENFGDVRYYSSQANHCVFSFASAPETIFKMKANKSIKSGLRDDSIKARYRRMVHAQTILRTHKLGQLVIPKAKLFSVDMDGEKYEFIAEQKLDISQSQSIQEQYFEQYAGSLDEAIRQLAVFICNTGYSDVEWRNNPVLNHSLDRSGRRKIALIDIEEMDDVEIGLWGGASRRGLIRCVNEKQAKIVEQVAKEQGVVTTRFANAFATRKKEIEKNLQLQKYYQTHNIITGREPIQVDLYTLGLDLSEKDTIFVYKRKNGKIVIVNDEPIFQKVEVTMKKVIEDVVNEINQMIQNRPEENSVKSKRHIILNVNKEPFRRYNDLGLSEDTFFLTEEEAKNRWLHKIIQALAKNGSIYELESVNGHGYIIQA